MIFYRFQGREALDTCSYCEFLVHIWFALGSEDKEQSWQLFEDNIKEALLEELSSK